MTSKIYIYPLQYRYEKDTTRSQAKSGPPLKKGRLGECPPRRRADPLGEWTPVCAAPVSALHHCHADEPAATAPECVPPRAKPCWGELGGGDSTETSHTLQPIPFEPVQKLEFVVALCNAVTGYTWMTDRCWVWLCRKRARGVCLNVGLRENTGQKEFYVHPKHEKGGHKAAVRPPRPKNTVLYWQMAHHKCLCCIIYIKIIIFFVYEIPADSRCNFLFLTITPNCF